MDDKSQEPSAPETGYTPPPLPADAALMTDSGMEALCDRVDSFIATGAQLQVSDTDSTVKSITRALGNIVAGEVKDCDELGIKWVLTMVAAGGTTADTDTPVFAEVSNINNPELRAKIHHRGEHYARDDADDLTKGPLSDLFASLGLKGRVSKLSQSDGITAYGVEIDGNELESLLRHGKVSSGDKGQAESEPVIVPPTNANPL